MVNRMSTTAKLDLQYIKDQSYYKSKFHQDQD